MSNFVKIKLSKSVIKIVPIPKHYFYQPRIHILPESLSIFSYFVFQAGCRGISKLPNKPKGL